MSRRQNAIETLGRGQRVVAPSMLKCDFARLADESRALEAAGAKVLHWDVMDGNFVANLTYGPPVLASVRSATDLVFDAHLMVGDPERYLDEYLAAGCDAITVHVEAVPEPTKLLRRIREADVASGLALNPGTPVEAVEPFLDDCDLVLVMSVEPGFGGQSFQPVALDKLRRLRDRLPAEVALSVDGGIGPATVADVSAAGANVFVAGSAVFGDAPYEQAIAELDRLAVPAVSSPQS